MWNEIARLLMAIHTLCWVLAAKPEETNGIVHFWNLNAIIDIDSNFIDWI